jgi:hypothetical protein
MLRSKKELVESGDLDTVAQVFLRFINKLMTCRLDLRIDKYPPIGGDMTFSVALRGVGYEDKDRGPLRQMLRHRFYADFIAEWILRRNVQQFLDYVAGEQSYDLDVQLAIHQHFGVGLDEERRFFSFNSSKLAAVVNEELMEVLLCPRKKQS